MAYRYEKDPEGNRSIVIDGWEKGTAASPYSGLHNLSGVNLEVPGEVSVGYGLTTSTLSAGGATLGVPVAKSVRWFTYGSPGVPSFSIQSFAILDAAGQVWESTSQTGTWTFLSSSNSVVGSSALDGLVYWMGYLWKFRNGSIDYWNGTVWVTGWQSITGAAKHFAYVASDNILYFTNGNYVGSIAANTPLTSFDPTLAGTYTFTAQKLQLPVEDVANSLCEIGYGSSPNTQLLIGGIKNAIYPWDKTSASFSVPIYVSDSFISNMVATNQSVLIFTGSNVANFSGDSTSRGRIYITNGSQANLWYKIPDYITGIQSPYFVWGDAIFHRNKLLFSFFVEDGSLTKQTFSGVYALEIQPPQIITTELETASAFHSISDLASGTGTICATVLISADPKSGNGLNYIAGTTDTITNTIRYSGTQPGIGSAVILTDLIPIGTFLNKTTQTTVEYKLRTALQSGESLIFIPFVDGSTAPILTFTPPASSGQLSGVANITWTGAQWLQFEVELTGSSESSGCRLREIRIRL